jgi:hypothetical protein
MSQSGLAAHFADIRMFRLSTLRIDPSETTVLQSFARR